MGPSLKQPSMKGHQGERVNLTPPLTDLCTLLQSGWASPSPWDVCQENYLHPEMRFKICVPRSAEGPTNESRL